MYVNAMASFRQSYLHDKRHALCSNGCYAEIEPDVITTFDKDILAEIKASRTRIIHQLRYQIRFVIS